MDYLVFRLYGPMASWGDIAVGVSRHSANHPGKSALMGLLAAALGVDRDDEEKQIALNHDYSLAIKQFTTGTLLYDFHTVQAPDSVGKFQYRTRRDELIHGKNRLGAGALRSAREYLTDSVALVAIRALDNSVFSLQQIKNKLLKPVFHLYLGRKSCPLSIPLSPQIILETEGVKRALDSYQWHNILPSRNNSRDDYWFSLNNFCQYYWEGDINDFVANESTINVQSIQTLTRHDQLRSRKRWQFSPRLENFYQQTSTGHNNIYQGGN